VLQILELYRRVYEEYLAIPVIKGKKTENEKFPGGLYTTTVEAFIPGSGRGVQGATSHCLGQNFAKMFGIEFEKTTADKDSDKTISNKQLVWQNSWGLTTRSIGVMVMVHGDWKGLVLPPKVAPVQVIILPIFPRGGDTDTKEQKENARKQFIDNITIKILKPLLDADIRAQIDESDTHQIGFKHNHWEMKGVPLRFEFGESENISMQLPYVRRDQVPKDKEDEKKLRKEKKDKLKISFNDSQKFVLETQEILKQIQNSLFEKAKKEKRRKFCSKCYHLGSFFESFGSKKICSCSSL